MARRGKRHDTKPEQLAPESPFQPVNSLKPIELIDLAEIRALHFASMQILEDTGLEVMSANARRLFEKAGCDVDEDTQRVRFPEGMISELIGQTPSSFKLHARNPDRDLVVGGKHMAFTPATTPPYVLDAERGRRRGNFADFCDLLRLGHVLPTMHLFTGYPVEPQDIPVPVRHLECCAAHIRLSDKIWRPYVSAPWAIRDGLEMAALARNITLDQLAHEPSTLTNTNINSPLRFDDALADGLIQMAELGQPCVVTSFTLAGAMAPITLEGALALQNAEVLAGIALTQIVRPGAPAVYGSFTSNVDMKTGSPALGTPEYMKAQIISGQLARFYGLPYRTSNACSANSVDAQAAIESQMSIWGAMMSGVNILFHGHGWLESGLTISFEKMIVDSDMLAMAVEMLKPMAFNAENLAVDVIAEVGPGGHFFGSAHTLARYKTAFFEPLTSDWRNYDAWKEAGELDAQARATPIWKKLLARYEEPENDPATMEQIDAFVARRKSEILTEAKAS